MPCARGRKHQNFPVYLTSNFALLPSSTSSVCYQISSLTVVLAVIYICLDSVYSVQVFSTVLFEYKCIPDVDVKYFHVITC